MDRDFLKNFEKAIIATKENHPAWEMMKQIRGGINSYLNALSGDEPNYVIAQNDFIRSFSSTNKDNENVREYFSSIIKSGEDVVLKLIDQMYYYSYSILEQSNEKKIPDDKLSKALDYSYMYWKYLDDYGHKDIQSMKYEIYTRPSKLYILLYKFYEVAKMYVNEVLINSALTIDITSFTDTGKKVFSNIENLDDFKLKDSYFAEHKSGDLKIELASIKGYEQKDATQQDAVLSVSKDGFSLNIVADGVGGSSRGERASSIIINEFSNWFKEQDFSKYKSSTSNPDFLLSEIKDELIDINQRIHFETNGESSSTIALAFFTPNYIICVSVGDSPTYVVKKNDTLDSIKPVNEIDSFTKDLPYEEARHSDINNYITNSVGGDTFNVSDIHSSIIPKFVAKRVVLASDGVTDLISYRNLLEMLKKNASAKDFVNKAKNAPDDAENLPKTIDNITMASIEIEDDNKKIGGLR